MQRKMEISGKYLLMEEETTVVSMLYNMQNKWKKMEQESY
jgi:hypothetical protein